MSQRGALSHSSGNFYLPKRNNGSGDYALIRREEEDARIASAELADAINGSIFRWGLRHGISADQARVLLLDRKMP